MKGRKEGQAGVATESRFMAPGSYTSPEMNNINKYDHRAVDLKQTWEILPMKLVQHP